MTQNTKCKYIHFGYTCLIDNICSSCRTDAHYAPKPKIKFIIKKKQVDCDDEGDEFWEAKYAELKTENDRLEADSARLEAEIVVVEAERLLVDDC